MNVSKIDCYAKVVLEYASEKKLEEILYEEMIQLKKSFCEEPSLQKILETPNSIIPTEEKQQLLKNAGGKDTSDVFNSFVQLLFDNKCEKYCTRIAKQYRELYRRQKGIITAKLKVAEKSLLPQDKGVFEEIINRKYSGKLVDFDETADSSIIGGFILDVGFERLDASIRNQLCLIREKFKN